MSRTNQDDRQPYPWGTVMIVIAVMLLLTPFLQVCSGAYEGDPNAVCTSVASNILGLVKNGI